MRFSSRVECGVGVQELRDSVCTGNKERTARPSYGEQASRGPLYMWPKRRDNGWGPICIVYINIHHIGNGIQGRYACFAFLDITRRPDGNWIGTAGKALLSYGPDVLSTNAGLSCRYHLRFTSSSEWDRKFI